MQGKSEVVEKTSGNDSTFLACQGELMHRMPRLMVKEEDVASLTSGTSFD